MSETSLDQLHATADVVWDYAVSGDLARKFEAAATAVEGHVGPRAARKVSDGTHFKGYYADLWAFNVDTANNDAGLLADRLREVARGIRDLEADARAEQRRIDAAREWKRKRDERSELQKIAEGIDFLNLIWDENPPKAEPVEQLHKTYDAPPKGGRRPFEGKSDTGVTSALPDDLRAFTSAERAATDEIRHTPPALQARATTFEERCRWGGLTCAPVLVGFGNYVAANDLDCNRTDIVAANFEAAGGSGQVSQLSDATIAESLRAYGVSEQRPQLEIPPVEAVGNPPTSGYANDPVNTATGNFVENEKDLRFEGGNALLGWARSSSR